MVVRLKKLKVKKERRENDIVETQKLEKIV